MKTFEEFRKDHDAITMATTFNGMKRKGNNLPYFALLKMFLDETKSMEDIASVDGISVSSMRRLYQAFFAPVIDPEKERARASYLSASRKSGGKHRRLNRLNGSAYVNDQ